MTAGVWFAHVLTAFFFFFNFKWYLSSSSANSESTCLLDRNCELQSDNSCQVTALVSGPGTVDTCFTDYYNNGTCTDALVNGQPWTDSEGYDCALWVENPSWCLEYPSSSDGTSGIPASEACCVCRWIDSHPSFTTSSSSYSSYSTSSSSCTDLLVGGQPWQDPDGYQCRDYTWQFCQDYSSSSDEGVLVGDACCVCGGGVRLEGSFWTGPMAFLIYGLVGASLAFLVICFYSRKKRSETTAGILLANQYADLAGDGAGLN